MPLAALAAYGLASLASGLLNFDMVQPAGAGRDGRRAEVAVAVRIPLVAAAIPVWRGAPDDRPRGPARRRRTAEQFGHGRLDRALARLRGLPRPTLLSIRNTFRRKVRLGLTLAALAVGGMVFMTVFTVRDSLYATLDDTVRYFNYDVQVELTEPARAATVVDEALAVPGVTVAEPWRFAERAADPARRVREPRPGHVRPAGRRHHGPARRDGGPLAAARARATRWS